MVNLKRQFSKRIMCQGHYGPQARQCFLPENGINNSKPHVPKLAFHVSIKIKTSANRERWFVFQSSLQSSEKSME